jgi:protein-S-isoprenylcysteine O-methyltransferase Ste14
MNLPVGVVSFACLFYFLETPKESTAEKATIAQQVWRLDPLGTLFFLPSMVCLILALQWGGSEYAWNSWRVIVLLVIFAVTIVIFCVIQILMPQSATVPVRVMKQRSALAGTLYMIFLSGAMMILVYYIPFWCEYFGR